MPSGCPKCSKEINAQRQSERGLSLTMAQIIDRAHAIHRELYSYSAEPYLGKMHKIAITCKQHGEFKQKVASHLSGQGCPECFRDRRKKPKTTTAQFIEKAIEIHGNRYDYSMVSYKTNNKEKISIICREHGVFEQTPAGHLRGQGCLVCCGKLKITTDEFKCRAVSMHGSLYIYDNVEYVDSYTKVLIECKKHGKFKQNPRSHLKGIGCPQCSSTVSNTEIAFLELIGVIERHKMIRVGGKKFICDGFDPETNTIYEFDGDFWHGNPRKHHPDDVNARNKKTFGELHDATIKKRAALENAGFNVVHIWEDEWPEFQRQWREAMEV